MSTKPHYKHPNDFEHTTFEQLSTTPANLKYSFGGLRNRFRKLNVPLNQKVGYDLPTTKSPKACSFGIGDRFKDVNKSLKKDIPFYELHSFVDPNQTTSHFSNHMKNNSYCFGAGREEVNKSLPR